MASKLDDGARARGYDHAFHEKGVTRILARARRYKHRSRAAFAPPSGDANGLMKGTQIRARIAANAKKRLELAEAMKAEAGVEWHTLIRQQDGGLAWAERAQILAPAGENRVQLATLAHECGHVFLHHLGRPAETCLAM